MDGLRLGGHPVHPMLTDFPMALLSTALLWDLIAVVTGQPRWSALAFWTMAVGVVALLPTAATGLMDFIALPADSPAGPTAVRHMVAVLVAGALFTASLLARGGPDPADGPLPVLLAFGGFLALLVGGRLGGALVFRHGVGRTSGADVERARTGGTP